MLLLGLLLYLRTNSRLAGALRKAKDAGNALHKSLEARSSLLCQQLDRMQAYTGFNTAPLKETLTLTSWMSFPQKAKVAAAMEDLPPRLRQVEDKYPLLGVDEVYQSLSVADEQAKATLTEAADTYNRAVADYHRLADVFLCRLMASSRNRASLEPFGYPSEETL